MNCQICDVSDNDRAMIFRGREYCSDNCQKALIDKKKAAKKKRSRKLRK